MKVIITGATGMIGKGVLLECLDHSDITEVLSISRKLLEMNHPKLKQLIHPDFSEFVSVTEKLKGYNACYACMGVSSAGIKEPEYKKLTYDYTLSLATVLLKLNPLMTFIYVSGAGTDSSEKGKLMWARVKGKTENDILNLGFKQAFVFRPGAIIPKRGVQASSKLYRFLINNLSWLIKLVKFMAPNAVVDSTQIGHAMINVTKFGYAQRIINPSDILKLDNLN